VCSARQILILDKGRWEAIGGRKEEAIAKPADLADKLSAQTCHAGEGEGE